VYEMGEERLDGVAGKLKGVAKESLGDLDGVFGKLGTSLVVTSFDRPNSVADDLYLDLHQAERRKSRTPTLRPSAPSRPPLSARRPNSFQPFKSINRLRTSCLPT
jgi:hypothetical protein